MKKIRKKMKKERVGPRCEGRERAVKHKVAFRAEKITEAERRVISEREKGG